MGGHAFKNLHCPRIPPDTYNKVRAIATAALHTVFTHVKVPFEIPSKVDYGDCDFLVAAPFGDASEFTLDTFPFEPVVAVLRHVLGTPHGRRGFLTRDCLYFAIPLPSSSTPYCLDDSETSDEELRPWVQIDVKICFKPEAFSWMNFEINYASQSSILGSMIKPLGLTLDPEGLHIRLEEAEDTDWAGSMVWITKDPWTACRLLGLDRKAVDGGFESAEEIFQGYAGSWLFHPETFKTKLEAESYLVQHTHRSHFMQKWIPERYQGYRLNNGVTEEDDLKAWTARTRAAVREKVFTMFPKVAEGYFVKRSKYVNEVEERRLRDLIVTAIPTGTQGWHDDFTLPLVITEEPVIKNALNGTQLQTAAMQHGDLTPPPSPPSKAVNATTATASLAVVLSNPLSTPVHIDALPRQPPYTCKPSPPPKSMSTAARLACLVRWTAFSEIGTPYLLTSPHAKDFDLQWRDAIVAGAKDKDLVKWAEDMWWVVWVRQCVVNWRGMWAKRFEKEDAKAEKVRKEADAKGEAGDRTAVQEEVETEAMMSEQEAIRLKKDKMSMRLEELNRALAFLETEK